MTAAPLGLGRGDLSAMCRSAADVAAAGQRRTKLLVRCELIALVGAAAAGVHGLHFGSSKLDGLAAVAGILFLVSLGCLTFRSITTPENTWYAGRAGAESVRTLAWRYSIGGDPFPTTLTEKDAADLYLDRLTRILKELADLELAPAAPDDRELTPAMKRVRAASFADRRAVYLRDRIENQIRWYTGKSEQHAKAARFWLSAAALASGAGVIAAGLRLFSVVDVDLLGVAAGCASAAIAWNQLNQNRMLVAAYRVTARELVIIRDRAENVDEQHWPAFVSDAEDAVSREHTLWLARHGHPGLAAGSRSGNA